MLKKLVMLCVALMLSLSAGFASAVEVNSADQAALESVKGIGPVHAKAIIEERTKNGPFKDADDLATRVKGIGSKSVVNLEAAGLTINGSSTPPTGAKPAAKSTATKTAPAANTAATAPTTATTATPAAPADASGAKASKSSKKKAKAAASDAAAASAPPPTATAPAAPAAAASAPADASGAKASKKKAKKSKAASAAAASGGA
ncbi:ComEA family DNA-binding protein [Paraburkholderia caledonica]|uniref:Competence protein ComEA n=1 Tax=Paraburkholderia caledonica TaxID=134536 RepID=A0AB73I8C4_9BURK|nr:competence protein ComEA [Paraburkholderia caledonica]